MRVTLTDVSERAIDKPIYYALGLPFLALAKAQYLIRGYKPKPIPSHAIERCINYDLHIAGKYMEGMARYGVSLQGKNVLELGPGTDLGVGCYLLSQGAASYTGFDRHDNMRSLPMEFYARVRDRGIQYDQSKLHLKVSETFSLVESFEPASFDIVLSNSAFEHFDDVERVMNELSWVLKPGGVICAGVDLQTHSRWIREADPNNIYRYSESIYKLFKFPGQCNRLRTQDYVRHLSNAGFEKIDIRPGEKSVKPNRARVAKRFRNCDDLDVLAFSMNATLGNPA